VRGIFAYRLESLIATTKRKKQTTLSVPGNSFRGEERVRDVGGKNGKNKVVNS